MILSNEGKPNPYDNFNSAPILIDPVSDSVIYTPLYYLLSHFSKFIRPGAHRIGLRDAEVQGVIQTAAKNPDGSIAVVVFNSNEASVDLDVRLGENSYPTRIAPRAMQTIHLRAP
jgi:glucosylceramidase